jgi:cytochrome c2
MRIIWQATALSLSLALAACEAHSTSAAQSEADKGAQLIGTKGCGLCHSIPGIASADGNVGPPLDHIASRVYIAGMLRNSPDNLARWIRTPQEVVPGNAMPDMDLSKSEARAIAAYLDTLK